METGLALEQTPSTMADRRQHPRYRLVASITVHSTDGSSASAITLEISESGLSALVGAPMAVGDKVVIEPVMGSGVTAVLQRLSGRVCGFRFLEISAEQVELIRQKCKKLPRFTSKIVSV